MSTNINYLVTFDSIISAYSSLPTGSFFLYKDSMNNPQQASLKNISFSRNIAPSDDSATLTIAGILRIPAAREVYFYRVNSDGSLTLKARGMTTNPTYQVEADGGLLTMVDINSLFYMLQTRLFQIAGKSPPPLQPNTNPYLVYLNPNLNLRFGEIWTLILSNAFQESYSTGHLPPLRLANVTPYGTANANVSNFSTFTDFDQVVVNDNMNVQYQNISAVIDRLVTSALFNGQGGAPFLAEYRMDIGDFPIPGFVATTLTATAGPGSSTFHVTSTDGFADGQMIYIGAGLGTQETFTITGVFPNTLTITVAPNSANTHYAGEIVELTSSPAGLYPKTLPTLTVMLFDPIHSKLGNGQNRSGIHLGDNSLDPAGTLPANLLYPMDYVEFGVTNGYLPVDTIVYSEGDNIVSIKPTYDYVSMNNSWVLTGGSFQGSDVVATPIENQRSIAEYGLKQTNQTLANVVDPGEIQRYVGTSIGFFQHPIPNIELKPDYTYASSHVLYPGDYILINAPSLQGVMEDSNGNLLGGSYDSSTGALISVGFTARVKTINIKWDADNGEDISIILTFPVLNVPLGTTWANNYDPTSQKGSNAGAMQSMYTSVAPSDKSVIGKNQQQTGASVHQGGGDFITNRNSPLTISVNDTGSMDNVNPDFQHTDIPIWAQEIPNNANISIYNSMNKLLSVKADDVLIYQFGVEVDSALGGTAQNDVWLTVLQPDGLTIYDSILGANQLANILSLLSKSHASPLYTGASAQLLDGLSGKYEIILRNTAANAWCPDPLMSTLPSPVADGGSGVPFNVSTFFIFTAVDAAGYEFAMTGRSNPAKGATIGFPVHGKFAVVPGAVSYNAYVANEGPGDTYASILDMTWNGNSVAGGGAGASWSILGGVVTYTLVTALPFTADTQPFDTSNLTEVNGLNVVYTGSAALGANLVAGEQYWYIVTALNPEGNESDGSQAGTIFTGNNAGVTGQPDANTTPEPLAPQQVEIRWPIIPYAQSYNVYRSTQSTWGGLGNLDEGQRNTFDLLASGVTATEVIDDGTVVPDNTHHPPEKTTTNPSNVTYTAYINYSYQSDPTHTQSIQNAQTNNPNTAINYNPTQRRVYGTHFPFVAP